MRLLGEKSAAYMRLSREDGDKLESDSIKNQRELITDFVHRNDGLELVDEYVDDGYTGTNFERPAFQRLMTDVQSGKINCIIVKDLSRLGRNYIEAGRYLEKIFPFLGVRFISILDHYDNTEDSDDAGQIIVPFKNLINDAYCRDMSTKVRSQLDVKRKDGKFIGSFASYGYKKDPKDKNHLVIDPVAADIVRMIFRLKLEGYNSQRIAETLNNMHVLPPAEYKRSCGLNYDCGFRSGKNPKWEVNSINRILTNEIYTGTMVQGKTQKINYKVKKSRSVPQNEWVRVPNTHEPIIDRNVFQDVQKLLSIDTRTSPEEDAVYLFSGLIVCGDCGQNMVRRRNVRKGRVYNYFHCSTYKNGNGCSSHLINAGKLESIVLEAVQRQISLLLQAEEILAQIDHVPEEQSSVKVITSQIEEFDKEIGKYQGLKVKVYTDMVDGLITEEEFKEINNRFSEKLEVATREKGELKKKKHQILNNKTYLQPWLQDLKKYQNITKLNRQMVVSLIDRIIIYDKDNVSICFHYQDEMNEVLSLAEEQNLNLSESEDVK